MSNIKIITDSCADIPKDLRDKYKIDYLKMKTVRDGMETPADLDWAYFTPEKFYDSLRGGARITTSPVSQSEMIMRFRSFLEQGFEIIYVACSGKMSASVFTAQHVAERLAPEFPDGKIFCIDSLNASMGEGLLAIRAAELRDMGKTAEEINDEVCAVRNNVNQFVTVHSLSTLRQAGRVTVSSAFFGDLLDVKPVIISDISGNNLPIKKVKGRSNSISELVKLTAESIEEPQTQTIFVMHSDCLGEAEMTAQLLRESIDCREVRICTIGAVSGASIGAGALAVFSFGKSVKRFAV